MTFQRGEVDPEGRKVDPETSEVDPERSEVEPEAADLCPESFSADVEGFWRRAEGRSPLPPLAGASSTPQRGVSVNTPSLAASRRFRSKKTGW